MNARKTLSALIFLILIQPVALYGDAKADKMKQRLDQLFLWRVSDRLQLSTEEENIFQEEFKRLSEEKQALISRSENILDQIEKNKSDKKKAQQLMKQYVAAAEKLNALSVREVHKVEGLFGSQKAAEYVLLKREMTQKFKDALTQDRSQAPAK